MYIHVSYHRNYGGVFTHWLPLYMCWTLFLCCSLLLVLTTSIKIIKNEIGCRDDTVPKTVGTRRHCEEDGEHATIFRNPQKARCREGVAEDCCMLSILLTVPSCTYSFWHGVIPTSYFIFILVLQFFMHAARWCPYPRTYAHAYYARELTIICALDMRSRSRVPYRGRHLNGKMALYYTEITAKTWISLSKGTKLLLYRKDHARSKLRAFHVKL